MGTGTDLLLLSAHGLLQATKGRIGNGSPPQVVLIPPPPHTGLDHAQSAFSLESVFVHWEHIIHSSNHLCGSVYRSSCRFSPQCGVVQGMPSQWRTTVYSLGLVYHPTGLSCVSWLCCSSLGTNKKICCTQLPGINKTCLRSGYVKGTVQRKLSGVEYYINKKVFFSH